MAFSVDWQEVDGSPQFEFSVDGFRGRRVVQTAWTDLQTYCEEVLSPANNGWPTAYGGFAAYAYKTSLLSQKGAQNNLGSGYASYSKARIQIEYTSHVFNLNNDVVGWERIDAYGEAKRLSHEIFQWSSGSSAVPLEPGESPTFWAPGFRYRVGFSGVATIPSAVLTHHRSVNASIVSSITLGLTFPAQTLLFEGWQAHRMLTRARQQAWWFEEYFAFKPNYNSAGTALGWNYEWRPASNTYEAVYLQGTGTQYLQYPAKNFNALSPV